MMMNKVESVGIAGEVFWIDERAYASLKEYFNQIRLQLEGDEGAEEIFTDFELRVAELLYEARGHAQKVIDPDLAARVIEQVGYVDPDLVDEEGGVVEPQPKRKKILAGVCVGLSERFGVPVFLLRVMFLGTTVFLGLGLLLYLIFWLSLETYAGPRALRSRRKRAEGPWTWQQKIFFPLTLLGFGLASIRRQIAERQGFAFQLIRGLGSFFLIVFTLSLSTVLLEFSQGRFFGWYLSGLIIASVMYLNAVMLFLFIRRFYLTRPNPRVLKPLFLAAVPALLIIFIPAVYINLIHAEPYREVVEKQFPLDDQVVALQFNQVPDDVSFHRSVQFQIRTAAPGVTRVGMRISYTAYGPDVQAARENLGNLEFFYRFDQGVLEMDRFWTLKDAALKRGQQVKVVLEIPQNTVFKCGYGLVVVNRGDDLYYEVDFHNSREGRFLAQGSFLFQLQKEGGHVLDRNDRRILTDQFCRAFFLARSWSCYENLNTPLLNNHRFDTAFLNEVEAIETIRLDLLQDHVLTESDLQRMTEIVETLAVQHPDLSELEDYLNHLRTFLERRQSFLIEEGEFQE